MSRPPSVGRWTGPGGGARRVVMFVLNDCRTDARVLREAGTLARAGYDVTVVARTSDPYARAGDRETRDGFVIRRVPVAGGALRFLLLARRPGALFAHVVQALRAEVAHGPAGWFRIAAIGACSAAIAVPVTVVGLPLAAGLLLYVGLPGGRARWGALEWRLQWRFAVMPWSRAAAAEAPPADVLHAHDLRALPAARLARAATGVVFVYDSHEIFSEAGTHAGRPGATRVAIRTLEARLAHGARAVITVNEDLAAYLEDALGLPERAVVVRNCPPRWDPGAGDSGRLRAAAGIPDGAPVVLSHGGFVAHRGFEEVAAALALPSLAHAHGVFLGSGPLRPTLERLASDPRLAGRLHLLDSVPPGDLPGWIAGADVSVVATQPTSLNNLLSTPNKIYESLAAGVPVVSSEFPQRSRILLEDPLAPLGEVCDPTNVAAIAAAVRRLLDLPPGATADLRRRCLLAAHERYAWEIDARRLLHLYVSLRLGVSRHEASPDDSGIASRAAEVPAGG